MDRRTFFKQMGGLAIVGVAVSSCLSFDKAAAWLGTDQVSLTNTLLLNPELQIQPDFSGAMVYFQNQLAFEVNEEGFRLLQLANGEHTLAQIIDLSGYDEAETAAFFVSLGESGYLQQRIEVNIVETRT